MVTKVVLFESILVVGNWDEVFFLLWVNDKEKVAAKIENERRKMEETKTFCW